MTNQEVYDRVKAHLLTQGRKALNTKGLYGCRYRTADGLKCAIGGLIPDDKYNCSLEGMDAVCRPVLEAAGLEWEQRDLAAALQRVHDNNVVEDWPEKLVFVARRFELQP